MKPALFLLAALPVAALAQLVPDSYSVPREYRGADYRLVPLGPDVAKLDYEAYMSSIDHIRASTGGNWPRPGLTLDDQAKDMAGEKSQWDQRKSFPYAVLSLDGSKEYGCFYIRPSRKEGYEAVATMWVTKEQFDNGFEPKLYQDMKASGQILAVPESGLARAATFRRSSGRPCPTVGRTNANPVVTMVVSSVHPLLP